MVGEKNKFARTADSGYLGSVIQKPESRATRLSLLLFIINPSVSKRNETLMGCQNWTLNARG